LNWGSGALYPSGAVDYMGGTFSGPSYLDSHYNTPCYECLGSIFDQAKACYDQTVSQFSSVTPNAIASLDSNIGGQLDIVCSSSSANRYYIQVDASLLSLTTSYMLDSSCNVLAQYVITVTGNSDVYFYGRPFPSVAGGVVYIIPGSRVVQVTVEVNGAIIAPDSTHVAESGGVVKGKVVAGDIPSMVQFNRPCEDDNASRK